jgi:hypothetical protein
MHIADVEGGNLGANGVVGGGIPISVGVALALRMQKRGQIVLCFFGDGAANNGAFHESLNMAAIWKLPVVFVCENNGYAMSTPFSEASAIKDVEERASAYGMSGVRLDGNDFLEVLDNGVHGYLPEGKRVIGLDLIKRSAFLKHRPFLQLFAYAQMDKGADLSFSFAAFAPFPVIYRTPPPYPWEHALKLEWFAERVKRKDFRYFDYAIIGAADPSWEPFLKKFPLDSGVPE